VVRRARSRNLTTNMTTNDTQNTAGDPEGVMGDPEDDMGGPKKGRAADQAIWQLTTQVCAVVSASDPATTGTFSPGAEISQTDLKQNRPSRRVIGKSCAAQKNYHTHFSLRSVEAEWLISF
jgi:hypothetical protein